jgi:hypothetical protein
MIICRNLNGVDIISVTMQLVCSYYVYECDVVAKKWGPWQCADKGLGFMLLEWMIDRMRWWYRRLALLALAEKRREEETVVSRLNAEHTCVALKLYPRLRLSLSRCNARTYLLVSISKEKLYLSTGCSYSRLRIASDSLFLVALVRFFFLPHGSRYLRALPCLFALVDQSKSWSRCLDCLPDKLMYSCCAMQSSLYLVSHAVDTWIVVPTIAVVPLYLVYSMHNTVYTLFWDLGGVCETDSEQIIVQ